jgi:hypothetical protein
MAGCGPNMPVELLATIGGMAPRSPLGIHGGNAIAWMRRLAKPKPCGLTVRAL